MNLEIKIPDTSLSAPKLSSQCDATQRQAQQDGRRKKQQLGAVYRCGTRDGLFD
jgi:hypothetical protein